MQILGVVFWFCFGLCISSRFTMNEREKKCNRRYNNNKCVYLSKFHGCKEKTWVVVLNLNVNEQ